VTDHGTIEPIAGHLAGQRTTAPHPPEARLLAAVIIQAIVDAPKQNADGASARAFLDDPGVQALAHVLWDVRISADLQRKAAQTIEAYRLSKGRRLHHQRRQRHAEPP